MTLTSFAETFVQIEKKYPNREAIVEISSKGTSRRRTFKQFSLEVEAAREMIREAGHQSIVATVAGNTYPHLLWITATWLEGRTLCPINPDEGNERINQRVKQLGEPVSLWQEKDMILPTSVPEKSLSPPVARPIDRPMNLIFTSGSTGYSKIVEQMESQVLANAQGLIRHHKLDEDSVIATPLPIFHVNALTFSFLCSLLVGGKFVLLEKFQPHALSLALGQEKVQICSVVPHILHTLLERIDSLDVEQWTELRYFVSAASAMSPQLALKIVDQFPVRVLQGYGLSEAVNFSCTNPIDFSDDDYRKWMTQFERPSVGIAIWGNEIDILGESGQPLGPNQKGEISIRGLNLMRGYRNDDQTSGPRTTLMTGDVGFFEFDERGRKLFFVTGRSKETIKRLGHTISLLEIDDLLTTWNHWGRHAITVPFDHHLAGEELAIVVQDERAPLNELIEILETKLPEYMRPRLVATTNDPVRTASGKPLRWKFKDSLRGFEHQLLGTRIQKIGSVKSK